MKSEVFIAHRVEEGTTPYGISGQVRTLSHAAHFIACRVLGGDEGAADVVENCVVTGSRNLPTFESEGAFRCWLLRVLIDEALLILLQRREKSLIARDPNIGNSYRELEAS
jgi:DNA-directed RNA polymerase specialized sigma24 family protein